MRRLAALNAMLMCAAASGFAQQLDVHFSCSSPGDDHGDKVIYADSGMMAFAQNNQDLRIDLYSGEVHEYSTTEPTSFTLTRFVQNQVTVRNVQNAFRESAGGAAAGGVHRPVQREGPDRMEADRQGRGLDGRGRVDRLCRRWRGLPSYG